VSAFQQTGSISVGGGSPGLITPGIRAEMGRPFSAVVTTKSTQIFLDGTHVTQTTTAMECRDVEGRTRTESDIAPPISLGPGEPPLPLIHRIYIRDPVAGISYDLDPAHKTALKMPRIMIAPGIVYDGPGSAGLPGATQSRNGAGRGRSNPPTERSGTVGSSESAPRTGSSDNVAETAGKRANNILEDLGQKNINGITAHGTRITTVVPVGAIGNDREFRSTTERWFSDDLNLLVKSVSSDPRFGTTTYELTNISRLPPDPSLFRPPPDYNIISPGTRQ